MCILYTIHTYCTCGYNTTYIVTYIYSTHKLQLQHVLLTSVSVYLTLKRHYCFAYTHTYIYASLIIHGVSTKCTTFIIISTTLPSLNIPPTTECDFGSLMVFITCTMTINRLHMIIMVRLRETLLHLAYKAKVVWQHSRLIGRI